jgi:hypothetical protein
VYTLYGALDQVENTHLPNEGHDYGPSKREAMYRFMAKHLRLNLQLDESDTVTDPAVLHVFTAEHPRPRYALKNGDEVLAELKKMQSPH